MAQASPDSILLKKISTLQSLKSLGVIGSPEFEHRKNVVLEDAGYGEAKAARNPRKKLRHATGHADVYSDGESDDECLPLSTRLSGSSKKASKSSEDEKRSKGRRLKRKADILEKMGNLSVDVWVHYEDNSIQEWTICFEFETENNVDSSPEDNDTEGADCAAPVTEEQASQKEQKQMRMWSCNEKTGIWNCAVCRSKTKGTKYDPAQENFGSKMKHNQTQDHIRALLRKAELPIGAKRWVPWHKGYATYRECKEWYEKQDQSTQDGKHQACQVMH